MQRQKKTTSKLQNYDAMAKLAIIGDSSVGKTNILLRYINSQVNMSHIATIGIDFKVKSVNIDGYKLKLQIWDTAGQERFRNLTGTVYQGAQAILLVYSVTDRKTFLNLNKWVDDVNNNAPSNVIIALAGNKTDLENQRVVSYDQGQKMSKTMGNCVFFETSAKDNTNISQLFNEICKKIKQKLNVSIKKNTKKNPSPTKQPGVQPSASKQKQKTQTLKLKKESQSKQDKKKKCC